MTLPLWGADVPGPNSEGDGPAGRGRPEPRRLSLVRLSGEIARSLASVGRVAVEGEVHRPQTSRAGWVYFTLRDRAAQLPVTCPARNLRRCRTVDGERVAAVVSQALRRIALGQRGSPAPIETARDDALGLGLSVLKAVAL